MNILLLGMECPPLHCIEDQSHDGGGGLGFTKLPFNEIHTKNRKLERKKLGLNAPCKKA